GEEELSGVASLFGGSRYQIQRYVREECERVMRGRPSRHLVRPLTDRMPLGNDQDEDCRPYGGGTETYEQVFAAFVIDGLYVCVTNRGGRVRLAIANHKVIIANAVNITLHFRPVV